MRREITQRHRGGKRRCRRRARLRSAWIKSPMRPASGAVSNRTAVPAPSTSPSCSGGNPRALKKAGRKQSSPSASVGPGRPSRTGADRAGASRLTLLRLEHQMVMLAELVGIDPPGARHAEVEDHRVAAVGVDQAVFGAPAERGDPCTRQPLAKIDRKGPAQVGAARLDAADSLGP